MLEKIVNILASLHDAKAGFAMLCNLVRRKPSISVSNAVVIPLVRYDVPDMLYARFTLENPSRSNACITGISVGRHKKKLKKALADRSLIFTTVNNSTGKSVPLYSAQFPITVQSDSAEQICIAVRFRPRPKSLPRRLLLPAEHNPRADESIHRVSLYLRVRQVGRTDTLSVQFRICSFDDFSETYARSFHALP